MMRLRPGALASKATWHAAKLFLWVNNAAPKGRAVEGKSLVWCGLT